MDEVKHYRHFRIGTERYRVVIFASGEVVFHLAVPRRDRFGHDISSTSLENSGYGMSVTVFRRVVELLDDMVWQYRPPLLWLKIDDEERRSLYGKLVSQFLSRHRVYQSCDQKWVDRLYLVRTAQAIN